FLCAPYNGQFSDECLIIRQRAVFFDRCELMSNSNNFLPLFFNVYSDFFIADNNSGILIGMSNRNELSIIQMWFSVIIIEQIEVGITFQSQQMTHTQESASV